MSQPTQESTCRHCGIRIIRLDATWEHQPEGVRRTYWHCRTTVAGPSSAEQIASIQPQPTCPTCGPTSLEYHPRIPGVQRCYNCKEHLPQAVEAPTPPDCPKHIEKQHRDGNPPWCNRCGWRHAVPSRPAVQISDRPRLSDLP